MIPELVDLDAALRTLAQHWTDLHDARLIGTALPWTEPAVSPERRAQMDAKAREERHDVSVDAFGNAIAVGESPAPCRVDVLDLLAEITVFADAVACQAAMLVGLPEPAPASSAYASPGEHLRFVQRHLAAAMASDPAMVISWVRTATQLERETLRALRLVRDGQVLKARCPWCDGAGQREPRWTLRIRQNDRYGALVVCTNPGCTPPSADVSTWVGHQPAWAPFDWDWLAKRLQHGEETA